MEKKFMIMTDVTTDLTEQWFIDNDVIPAIHGIVMDGVETWFDFGRTLRTKDVYAKIRSGVMPSTLQVQYEQFVRDFSEACEKGMDAMYVGFSSAMSGCVSTSMMAAQEVMEKYPDRKVIT
ncbi:MAG: DegV family protein, partial [Angelakisella sp.]